MTNHENAHEAEQTMGTTGTGCVDQRETREVRAALVEKIGARTVTLNRPERRPDRLQRPRRGGVRRTGANSST